MRQPQWAYLQMKQVLLQSKTYLLLLNCTVESGEGASSRSGLAEAQSDIEGMQEGNRLYCIELLRYS